MKSYKTEDLRNITVIGHAGSGKTILTEAMLYLGGIIKRKGEIESKNTISDYREIEHHQENSVLSTVLYSEINDKKINVIDTPGSYDFIGGAITSLQIADAAVMTVNAQNSVEVGTEIMWRQTNYHNKPVVFVINQLDHEKANYEKTLEDLKNAFGSHVVELQYPVNTGTEFNAVIDLVWMKMLRWKDQEDQPEVVDIPEDEKEKAERLHNELIEAAAENDDELMELFFEQETLNEQQMYDGIKKGLMDRGMFPIFCMSAKNNMGVKRLMEFITNAVPSPDALEAPKDENSNEIKPDPKGPVALFVFKSSFETHLGEISFFKVMSGTVKEGMDLINANNSTKERLSQIYAVAGKNRTKVEELHAGDIGATVKLKVSKTNHTLRSKEADIQFPPMELPEPKHRSAIRAKSEADDEKLGESLQKIHEEDPTLITEYSKELKQLLLYGQGEYHLQSIQWLLSNVYGVETEFIKPKIPYRETITKGAFSEYRHKKQSGGAGQFGEVHLFIDEYDPDKEDPSEVKANGRSVKISIRDKQEHDLSWGGKLVFYNCIVGGVIDNKFMPAILKGIMENMEEGPLTGSYARDIRVFIFDGKMHEVDSNEVSFKIAGSKAFADAFKKAGPKIMEPIYNVEVLTPSDAMGDVMSDLQGRRAMIAGMQSEKGFEKIKAKVPLAEMHKYSTALSSLTNGRAMYTMAFAEYQQVPPDLQDKLLREYEASKEEEK